MVKMTFEIRKQNDDNENGTYMPDRTHLISGFRGNGTSPPDR